MQTLSCSFFLTLSTRYTHSHKSDGQSRHIETSYGFIQQFKSQFGEGRRCFQPREDLQGKWPFLWQMRILASMTLKAGLRTRGLWAEQPSPDHEQSAHRSHPGSSAVRVASKIGKTSNLKVCPESQTFEYLVFPLLSATESPLLDSTSKSQAEMTVPSPDTTHVSRFRNISPGTVTPLTPPSKWPSFGR